MYMYMYIYIHTYRCNSKSYNIVKNLISKSETFIYFRFITCKVKYFKHLFVCFLILSLQIMKVKNPVSQNIYIWVSSINDHPYSINYGCLLFFETTIMGNTADLAMIQKTNINTLHKEGKSQRVITERCGCLQSAVSKHIKCKVDWKEEIG